MKIKYFYAENSHVYERNTAFNKVKLNPVEGFTSRYLDVYEPGKSNWSIDAIRIPVGGRIELSYSEPPFVIDSGDNMYLSD